jgi:hypothetical protein
MPMEFETINHDLKLNEGKEIHDAKSIKITPWYGSISNFQSGFRKDLMNKVLAISFMGATHAFNNPK